MKISDNGLAIIKVFEGLRYDAYLDTAGIWTIGYGTIKYPDGTPVKQGDRITLEEAEEYLQYEVEEKINAIRELVTSEINQHQFDALSSFAYNLGVGALRKSTLLKKVNSNPSDESIRAEFAKWNRSGGKITNGLVKRRAMEANLYFS